MASASSGTDERTEKPRPLLPEEMLRGNYQRLESIDRRISELVESAKAQAASTERLLAVLEGGGAPAWMASRKDTDDGGASQPPAADGKPRCRKHPDGDVVRRAGEPWCPQCKAPV